MSIKANPHWIGPRRGTYVTVILPPIEGWVAFENGLRQKFSPVVLRGVVIAPYKVQIRDGDFSGGMDLITIRPFEEGTEWCYGWNGEEVDALRAAAAMR